MILAGGLGRRMGREKLSLEVDGLSLIEHVRNVLASTCSEVLVVGKAALPSEGVRHVADERPGRQGPLAGIEAGLAASRCDHVFVAAGDMPFLKPKLVDCFLERIERGRAPAVVPRHAGRVHPLCGAYQRALLPKVRAALDGGHLAVRGFLEGLDGVDYVGEELRGFGDPDVMLINVNTPEDLSRARREAGR